MADDGPGRQDLTEDTTPSAVIGIGASAGGLEALEAVLENAPDQSGYAYVIVTHLSPNFKSLMDELLGQHTTMNVQQVEDGVAILANHVYVIPPNTEMIAVAGRLLLSDRDPGNQIALPIDTFFRSLAREYGEKAVAVVLSGTGGDGSRALSAIRDAGGRVIVQDPDTAKYDGMPRAAMATGMANVILSPESIGETLFDLNRIGGDMPRVGILPTGDPEQDALDIIFSALFGSSSINFEAYKTNTVLRRINRRMVARKIDSMAEYAQLVRTEQEEADALNRDLLIGVTAFFRDHEAFEQLDKMVLQVLARQAAPDRPIRIWVPGCATGQEAYSIAMLLQRQFDTQGINGEAQIFATDLQREFIETAGRGLFAPDSIPPEWDDLRVKYMQVNEDKMLQIEPVIRRMVVFAHHNVMADPPFTRLDLVSCRNMLIYLQPEAQEQALSLIAFGLRRSGFLFLGPSETLSDEESSFTMLSKRWRIYRKERELAALHMPERRPPGDTRQPNIAPIGGVRRQTQTRREMELMPAYSALLERFAPPSIVIDSDRQLLHTFGDAREYLRPPMGLASLDVLDMVADWMRLPLATAIDRVRGDGKEVRYQGRSPDGIDHEVSVIPLQTSNDARQSYKLVMISPQETAVPVNVETQPVEILDNDTITRTRIGDLESELRHTKENLQATIEEVETSNEELQSTNEELMAANEELQSTNEELHSVNEELYSVNAEYQRKNDELIQLNRDMEALMASTDVGVIFVDDRLAIRRFTSPAKRIFNLIDEDQGRSLAHLTHTLVDADIVAIARRAVDQFMSTEHEYQSEDGAWWLLRCMPMKTPGSNAIGAIITAIDIDEVHKAQVLLERDRWRQSLITQIGHSFIVVSDTNWRIEEPVEGWESYTGQSFKEYSGLGWLDAVHPEDKEMLTARPDAEPGEDGTYQTSYRLWHAPSRQHRRIQLTVVPENSPSGQQSGWAGVVVDVEETVRSQQQLSSRENLLQSVSGVLQGRFALLDNDWRYLFVNAAYQDRWGKNDSIIGKQLSEVIPREVYGEQLPYVEAAYNGTQQVALIERVSEDHGREFLLALYTPLFGEGSKVEGISVHLIIVNDILADIEAARGVEEAFGRAILHSNSIHLVIDSASFAIQHASRGAARAVGRRAEELRKLKLTDLLPEYDVDRLSHVFAANVPAEGRKNGPLEIKTFVHRADGSHYDANLTVELEPRGMPGRAIVTIADISEAQSAQAILRRRNEELARSNSDLENFAYFASHDLQEPARKIGNFAGLVEEDLGDLANEDTREYLDIIRRAADRMLTLVQDLLTFSRVRTVEEQFTTVSLKAIAEEAASDRAPELKQAGGTIKVGRLPNIQGDAVLLSQLFGNLVSNAIKYRAPNRALKINITSKSLNDEVEIRVADNGTGFDSDDAEQVFGLFQRLHGPTGIPGSGVGLAICKRVAELHGGDIRAEARSGKGATFIITLPSQ